MNALRSQSCHKKEKQMADDNKSIVTKGENSVMINSPFGNFFAEVRRIIEESRNNAVRSVDYCRVQMYWNIGKRIFEEEQQGKERADYGTYIIEEVLHVISNCERTAFAIELVAIQDADTNT